MVNTTALYNKIVLVHVYYTYKGVDGEQEFRTIAETKTWAATMNGPDFSFISVQTVDLYDVTTEVASSYAALMKLRG